MVSVGGSYERFINVPTSYSHLKEPGTRHSTESSSLNRYYLFVEALKGVVEGVVGGMVDLYS